MNEPIFEIIEENKKGNYAKIVISPLAQGYGNTLGNSLRRVLLKSLPGAVATSVKISGVKHQFTTLKGVKEDILEFVLNLKKVRFEYKGEKAATISLAAVGPGEIRAKDLELPAEVKVANPEAPLAYLNEGAKLDAKITVESGYGYVSADEHATGEIGVIPLDSSFSPVERVSYKIEETRVGRLTNYDKLILEIWTDGTIGPKQALVHAAGILASYFQQIVSPKKVEKTGTVKVEPALGTTGKLSVEEIGLPTRVANALVKAGYETVEDLVKAKRDELVKIRNLGEKSVKVIEAALGEKGVKIGS